MKAGLPGGLRWRLAGAVLAVFALAAAALVALLDHAGRYAQQQALADAQRHVQTRVASMDQGWRTGAFSIAQQLELWLAAEPQADAARREARAHIWLLSALDQSDFTHAVVEDASGRPLFQHGSRAQAAPAPVGQARPGPLAWAWSEADALAYRRVEAGTLRWGGAAARLVLFAPLDNALLARMSYPGNEISVWRDGQRLAATRPASRPPGAREVMQTLAWDALPGAPQLRVLRSFEPVFSTGRLLAALAGAALALLGALWLMLGRWVREQAERTQTLQAVAAAYDHSGGLPPRMSAALQRVAASDDALGLLAHSLAGMMARIDEARQALQQSHAGLEQRVAERTRALADSEQFLRTMADSVPALIAYWDTDDRCRFANEMHRTWFGRSPEQMLGLTLAELLGDAVWATHQVQRDATLAGRPQTFQIDVPRPDGSVAQLQVHLAPDMPADGPAGVGEPVARGYTVVAVDVTALTRARAEAQAAAQAKSQFLANMSHEIRTPMNAIIGLTHLLARDAADTLQRDRLRKIDVSARHLLQVINDILDLSKIEAGKVVLEAEDFVVEDLLRRVVEIAGGPARDKQLELVVDTDALPERLRGRVLQRHAAEYLVRFEVHDTGPGIAPERQAHLFQAFEQLDATTTRRHGGTGLGLALTRHLAELMGGEAGVHSVPGEGSTFWITARLQRAQEAGDRAAPLALTGLRALLVDDLAEARATIAERLQSLGLVVDALPGGREALARVQRAMADGQPYDVMFVDWRMPEPDGIETLHALRRLLGEGMPPAALVTAYDAPALGTRAREAGAQALLPKPVTASTLLDTLVRLLRPAGAPLAAAPRAAGEAEIMLRRRHAGQRVLLVEDNAVNREVALETLSHAGLVVDSAENGLQAVELVATRSYDLVLMDVQMPVLDGLEATRRIRAAGGGAVPVIAMTANAFGDDRQACLGAGMNDHLPKPADPDALFAMLLRWLPLPPGAQAEARTAGPPLTDAATARLATVPGMDVADALARCGHRAAMLHRVVQRFIDTYRDGLPALRGGAASQWIGAAHSLRGACAAVGLHALATRLQGFEAAAAMAADADTDPPELAAEAAAIDAELCRVVAAAAAALGLAR